MRAVRRLLGRAIDATAARPFVAALVVLLVRGATLVHSAWDESVNYDEVELVYGGYRIWTAADWSVSPHPPVAKLVCGLPVALVGAKDPHPRSTERTATTEGDVRTAWAESRTFLHANLRGPHVLLRLARIGTWVTWVTLGLVVFVAARGLHGTAGAWLALALFATCPQMATYGRFATSDLPMTTAYLGALALLPRVARPGLVASAVPLGLLAGLALASRQQAVPLVALLPVSIAIAHGLRLGTVARGTALGSAAAAVALVAAYGGTALPHYWRGAAMFFGTYYGALGHDPYSFAGTTSADGWWWYFPAVVVIKQAPGHLLVLALAIGSFAVARPRRVEWPYLLPALTLAVLACASGINYTVRHLLAVWPLLFVLAGRLGPWLAGRRRVWVMLPLVASALEVGRVHPHYQGYASSLVGGPPRAYRYLGDGSLDAGQALAALDRWLEAHENPPVWLAYFGQGDPAAAAYALSYRCLPVRWDSDLPWREPPGIPECPRYLAVSAFHLHGFAHGAYRFLLDHEPVAQPGWAILVYDLEREPGLLVHLALAHVAGAVHEPYGERLAGRYLDRAAGLLARLKRAATSPSELEATLVRARDRARPAPQVRFLFAAALAHAGWEDAARTWLLELERERGLDAGLAARVREALGK